jgi:type III secretory pathway lipoprotein EscJ
MTAMVHLATADDAAEAEEIQAVLSDAGVESELQAGEEADTVEVLVSESQLEEAEDLLAGMTDDAPE